MLCIMYYVLSCTGCNCRILRFSIMQIRKIFGFAHVLYFRISENAHGCVRQNAKLTIKMYFFFICFLRSVIRVERLVNNNYECDVLLMY